MKKFTKFALSLFAAVLILGLPFLFADINKDIDIISAVSAADIVKSGSCGTNVTYTLDSESTLTISGTGDMFNDYSYSYSTIPWYSFRESIKNVIILDGVTNVGNWAFYNCKNLQSVVIAKSVTNIGDDAFSSCYRLQRVIIPESVTYIGYGAFYNCSSLQSVYIENLIKWFDIDFMDTDSNPLHNTADLYLNSQKVTDIIFPEEITKISTQLWGCTSLIRVTIPESVTIIGNYAFRNCSSLQSVTIPESVVTIGRDAFCGCSSLQCITIPDLVTSIESSTFEYCSSLQYIAIPDSITTIGNWAFSGCSSLKSIAIPNAAVSIGISAFSNCSSLANINLPVSVTNIGTGAFMQCNSLTDVYYGGTKTQWTEIAIGELNDALYNAEIHFYCKHEISEEIINCYTIYKCSKCGYVEKPEFITRMEQLCFYASCINERDIDCSTYELTIDDSVAFYGEVTKHNIDGLLLIAFSSQHNYGDYIYKYSNNGFTPHTYSVPKEDIEAMFREVFGLSNIDFSISKRYDTENEIFYDSNGFGWGPVNYVITYENAMYVVRVYDEISSEPQVFAEAPFITVTFDDNANITGIYFPESPEEAPLDDHNYTVTTTPPTCDDNGFTTYSCLCGYSYVDNFVEANHKWDNGTITTSATCKVSGVKTYICQYNSVHTKTENLGVNASKHVSTKNVYAVAPTCSAIGYTTGVYCNDCQKYISGHNEIAIDTDAHKWEDGIITTTATCKVNGIKTYTCWYNATHKKTENLGVNVSNHVNTKNVTEVKATCTTKGYSAGVYCNDCQKYISGHEEIGIDADAHKWDSGTITTTATCKVSGAKTYTCQHNASHKKTDNLGVNASNHVNTKGVAEVKSTCTTKGYTAGIYCNDCQQYIAGHEENAINPSNHVNTKNVPETPATFEKVGYTAGVYCNDCKKYISGHAEIPKIVPEFTDSKDAKESGNNIVSNNGLTVAQLLSQAGKGATIKTKDGKSVENAALIGTGMVLTMADGSKKEIVVYGDADGDGKISAADARLALRASVGLESYKEDSCYYKAANVESKDKMSASDARLILRASVGLENPKSWLKK